MEPLTSWEATVTRIVDADTLDVVPVTDPVGTAAGEVIRVRIVGIDAPELGTSAGKRAKRRLARWCPPGSKVTVVPTGALDGWGRTLARIVVNVGERMVADGFARRWR